MDQTVVVTIQSCRHSSCCVNSLPHIPRHLQAQVAALLYLTAQVSFTSHHKYINIISSLIYYSTYSFHSYLLSLFLSYTFIFYLTAFQLSQYQPLVNRILIIAASQRHSQLIFIESAITWYLPFTVSLVLTDQRNLGMSMKVERSSLDQVKARFEMNKRKQEEKKKEYDFSERMKELQEEVCNR